MIEVVVTVPDGRGGERLFKDYLTSTPLGALRLRHACEAVARWIVTPPAKSPRPISPAMPCG